MSHAVVNEGLIRALVGSTAARAKFPFLRHAYRMLTPRRSGCCGRTARSSLNIRAIKTTIFGMASTELQKLKDHLGVDKLVFYVPAEGGGTAHLER